MPDYDAPIRIRPHDAVDVTKGFLYLDTSNTDVRIVIDEKVVKPRADTWTFSSQGSVVEIVEGGTLTSEFRNFNGADYSLTFYPYKGEV